jgi:hypothetical protein
MEEDRGRWRGGREVEGIVRVSGMMTLRPGPCKAAISRVRMRAGSVGVGG